MIDMDLKKKNKPEPKKQKREVWKQAEPFMDTYAETYWFEDRVDVRNNPCPEVVCKCGAEQGGQTLKVSENYISCETPTFQDRHIMGITNVTKEYVEEHYQIIGVVIIGGIWRKGE